jgi:hypothetical protein
MNVKKLYALVLVSILVGLTVWGVYRSYQAHEINMMLIYSGNSLDWNSLAGKLINNKAKMYGACAAFLFFIVGYLILKSPTYITPDPYTNTPDTQEKNEKPTNTLA